MENSETQENSRPQWLTALIRQTHVHMAVRDIKLLNDYLQDVRRSEQTPSGFALRMIKRITTKPGQRRESAGAQKARLEIQNKVQKRVRETSSGTTNAKQAVEDSPRILKKVIRELQDEVAAEMGWAIEKDVWRSPAKLNQFLDSQVLEVDQAVLNTPRRARPRSTPSQTPDL